MSGPPTRWSPPTLEVAVIGGLDAHKGAAVFRALLRANRRAETTFHYYGVSKDPDLARIAPLTPVRLDGSRFVHHGPYCSDEIVHRLSSDRIDVGLQLSIWPETFSYTLSEFAAAGIPVIAGDAGALGERIRRCRLGWTVPDIQDPAATLAILDRLIDEPGVRQGVAERMDRAQALVPIEATWRRYADIYQQLIAGGRNAMNDPAPDKGYVAWLGMRLAEEVTFRQRARALEAELAGLQQRLRSPRYRIADTAANALQKIPIVWPVVSALTRAIQRPGPRRDDASGGKA